MATYNPNRATTALMERRYMNYETVILEKKDYIAKLTLNRPERMNAVSQQVTEDLLSAFDEVDTDDEVRVLIITGAGRAFCAGADVTEFPGGGAPQQDVLGSRIIRRLRQIQKPVIAMVNGAAVGGGCALAFACDMRVGSENSRFMNAFIRRGLSSGWAGPWMYPRLMGLGKALEILLTGDFLEAKDAERIGVLNKLVPADELEKETMALASKIAAGPPIAIRETKRRVYEGLESEFQTALQSADEGELVTVPTEDYKEGVRAFLEKRPPEFKGK